MTELTQADDLAAAHLAAIEKARLWAERAIAAHRINRLRDARRCEDKARDWLSKAKQIDEKREASQ